MDKSAQSQETGKLINIQTKSDGEIYIMRPQKTFADSWAANV